MLDELKTQLLAKLYDRESEVHRLIENLHYFHRQLGELRAGIATLHNEFAKTIAAKEEEAKQAKAEADLLRNELKVLRDSEAAIKCDEGACALAPDGHGCNTMSELAAANKQILDFMGASVSMLQQPRQCCVKHWEEDVRSDGPGWVSRPFVVCQICGNKRCPKATDCTLECTKSNEPGQKGSIY